MRYIHGDLLALNNNCGMACKYCGYADERVIPIELDALRVEAETAAARGTTRLTIVGKDPVEHPEFDAVLALLRGLGLSLTVQTAGNRLHAELGRAGWTLDPGICWQLPLCGADAELHDRIVGRSGHHEILLALMRDRRLDVCVNVLLIDAMLEGDHLARALELARQHRRAVTIYAFTPRMAKRPEEYYTDNAAPFERLWSKLVVAATADELDRFLGSCIKTIPICTVPAEFQLAATAHLVDRLSPGAAGLNDSSFRDLARCPREAGCPAGQICLGVYDSYSKRFGTAELDPARITRNAAERLRSVDTSFPTAIKRLLRGIRRVREDLAAGSLDRAAHLLAELAQDASVLPRVGADAIDELRDLLEAKCITRAMQLESRWRTASAIALVEALLRAGGSHRASDLLCFLQADPSRNVRRLLEPLRPGSKVGRGRLTQVLPPRDGVLAVVLEGDDGKHLRLDVLARDRATGAPAPPAQTEHYDVFVISREPGAATPEAHALAAKALAAAIAKNEDGMPALEGLATRSEIPALAPSGPARTALRVVG